MTKQLKNVCISIAALAIVVQSTAEVARGQSTGFRVIGDSYVVVGSSVYHLDDSNPPYGWKVLPYASITLPPIAASSRVSYDGFIAVTDAGEGWAKVGGVWTDVGPIPGTPTVKTSWGAVKSKYVH